MDCIAGNRNGLVCIALIGIITVATFYWTYDCIVVKITQPVTIISNTTTNPPTVATIDTTTDHNIIVNGLVGAWHQVFERKVLVFSAYYEDQSAPHVKLIAELYCRSNQTFVCRLIFTQSATVLVPATVKSVNQLCWNAYDAFFIMCPIPPNIVNLNPVALQLFANNNSHAGLTKVVPYIPITYRPNGEIQHKLAICVGRLFKFKDWLQIAFLVEFYKMMGATKFVFYEHSYSSDVEKLLKHYEHQGVADVIPFPKAPKLGLNGTDEPSVGTFVTFQNVQMNDCNYWLRGKVKYSANIDADEFILPNINETLLDLLERNDKVNTSWDAFLIRSQFVNTYWPSIVEMSNSTTLSAQLTTFEILTRQMYSFTMVCPFSGRPKSINKPDCIDRVANHGVWESTTGNRVPNVKEVDVDQAVIIHLRKLSLGEKPEKRPNHRVDCGQATTQTLTENPFNRLMKQLLRAVNETLMNLIS